MRGVLWLAALGLLGCGSSNPSGGGTSNPAGGGGGSSTSASRFVTSIVSYDAGPCAGFGQDAAPQIVEGPPVGGGDGAGSTNVLSLGTGGTLVLGFDTAIVDGPGVDFIVFENPFWIGNPPSPEHIYEEPGEVSVSEDGVSWATFPCAPPCSTPNCGPPPFGMCGGWHVVLSNPTNGIDPLDPAVAGGDPYDLADLPGAGIQRANFVRIVDKTTEACPAGSKVDTNGFDLDAIGIVNAAD